MRLAELQWKSLLVSPCPTMYLTHQSCCLIESIPSNLPAGLLNYEEEETEGIEDDGLGQSALDLSQTSCDQTLCQEFGGVCSTIDNHQQCLCKFDCSSSKEAVKCGELISDGTKRLYANECSLRKHACQKLGKIVVVSSDQCGGEKFYASIRFQHVTFSSSRRSRQD